MSDRRKIAVLLATSAVTLVADAGAVAATGKKVRCPGGKVELVVAANGTVRTAGKGKHVCTRIPPRPTTRLGALEAEDSLLARAAAIAPDRRFRPLRHSKPLRRLMSTISSYVNAALANRASSAAEGRRTEVSHGTLPGPDGKPMDAAQTLVWPGDDEVGRGGGSAITANIQTVGATVDKFDQLFVKNCPNGDGHVAGDFKHHDRTLTSLDIHGKHLIEDKTISWEGTLAGRVGDDGRIKEFDYHATGSLELKGRVVNGAGKLLAHAPTRVLRVKLDRLHIDPRHPAKIELSGPDASFNGRGPKGLIAEYVSSLADLAMVIQLFVSDEASDRYLEAEKHWNDEAGCLSVDFTPPAGQTVVPGQSIQLGAAVKSVPGGAEVSSPLSPTATSGATVTPDHADAAPGAPAQFTFTAPSQLHTGSAPGVRVDGVSKRGRVEGFWDTKVDPPYLYKILGATLTTDAKGTQGYDSCALGGITTKEERTLSSTLIGQPTPLVSKLDPKRVNGSRYVSGKIQASVRTSYVDSVDSCQFSTNGIEPCSFASPTQTHDGNVLFTVDYQPWADNTATLRGSWYVPDAEIGVASGSYSTNCEFPYMLFSVPPDETAVDVPLPKFTGTGPQTISFSGSKHFEHEDIAGYPNKMDYTWSMSITYQRVDENGNPL